MNFAFVRRRLVLALALLSLLAAAGLTPSASAADAYVPGNAATTEGSGFNSTLLGSAEGAFQFGIDSSLLTGLGSTITGLAFRLNGGASSSVPGSDVTGADFEIRIGTAAVAIGSMTTNFASNISDAVLLRDEEFTLTTGVLPGNGTTPNPFVALFTFATPYDYTNGASLVIEIRSLGFGFGLTLDAVPTNTANSLYRGFQSNSFTGETGSPVAFPVMTLLSPTAIPEPSTYAALAGAAALGLALLRRRRGAARGKR